MFISTFERCVALDEFAVWLSDPAQQSGEAFLKLEHLN